MKKSLFIASILSLSLVASVALAKTDKHYAPSSSEALESGVYDVEGHGNLKVKVFVHKGNAKPGGGSSLVCGLDDTDSTTQTPTIGWKLGPAISYYINVGGAPSTVSANLSTIVSRAFSQWTVASGVVFTNVGVTSVNKAQYDNKNIIAWGRTSGSALAVTYTWYDQSTGQVFETDTIFNDRFSWNWSNQSVNPNCAYSNVYDIQDILTHETGHWMGLDDTYTSDFTNNTMYGYGNTAEVKKDTLSSGDILGIKAIYQ